MITAKEAKEMSDEWVNEISQEALADIEKKILSAISDGKRGCYIKRDINSPTKAELIRLGYKLIYDTMLHMPGFYIQW